MTRHGTLTRTRRTGIPSLSRPAVAGTLAVRMARRATALQAALAEDAAPAGADDQFAGPDAD